MAPRIQFSRNDERREIIQQFITKNPGTQTKAICELIHVGHRRASHILNMMANISEIYRSGDHNTTRYWINEAAFNERPIKPAPEKVRKIFREEESFRCSEYHRSFLGGLIFLSHKRPAGINTIFDECKHNSQMLPVLYIMARRLYG